MNNNIIYINGEILYDLQLSISKKHQKNTINYFFYPRIGLKLYNAKVSWIDKSKKNLSFCFNKYDNISLFILLQNIYKKLDYFYKHNLYNPSLKINLAPFFYEKDDNFYIRTFLPKNIISIFNKNKDNERIEQFNIPNLHCIYDTIYIEFKNIWEDNCSAGFNIELKEINN